MTKKIFLFTAAIALIVLATGLLYALNIIPHRQYTDADFHIETYKSLVDQDGDIVIFKDHIGIVSDKRNRKGVPFLIHHYSPFQTSYEEDVLERYQNDPELRHYRMT